jgi:DNA-binding NarL/FixJ family response regulator
MHDRIETSAAFRIRENDANCRPRADALRPKVMVADDQRMLVDLLQDVLSPEFDLLAAATDGEELLAEMERQQPDIVVLGMNMPTIGGLNCGRFIRHSWPHVALVYLTTDDSPALAAEAFALGAVGYVLKSDSFELLLAAIRNAAVGTRFLTPAIEGGRIGALRNPQSRHEPEAISSKEASVVSLLARGTPMKEAARRLRVASPSVSCHERNGITKLRLQRNKDLFPHALRNGFWE